MRITPYTTPSGLRIGSGYQPDLRLHHDHDAVRLQSALLRQKPGTDWEGLLICAGCVAFVLAFVWVLGS